jgi:hypothetical protein
MPVCHATKHSYDLGSSVRFQNSGFPIAPPHVLVIDTKKYSATVCASWYATQYEWSYHDSHTVTQNHELREATKKARGARILVFVDRYIREINL